MTERLHFSIALPVHNGGRYLRATLESLIAQTYPYFETFILENASNDDTVEIVQSYQEKRFKLLPSAHLLSIEANWARILQLDGQGFLVLLCADDLLAPDFLQTMLSLIQAHPQATLFHSWVKFIDAQGRPAGLAGPVGLVEKADDFLRQAHHLEQAFFGSGYVMRLADFKAVGGYPPYPRLLFADLQCYYALAQLGHKVCAPAFLVSFRVHGESAGHNAHPQEFAAAAQAYLGDLDRRGYFQEAGRRQEAEAFVLALSLGAWRVYVHHFIKAGPERDESAYQAALANLPPHSQRARVYPFDLPFGAYLRLAKVRPYYLRWALFYILLLGVKFRQSRHEARQIRAYAAYQGGERPGQ